MSEQDWPDEARLAVLWALENGDPMDFAAVTDDVFAALAPHVTPTAPLRELADGWDGLADIANPGYSEILRRAANKLREVIDRG